MNKELKNKWISALRSGAYEQGRVRLARKGGGGQVQYCCLGVLLCVSGRFRSNWQFRDLGALSTVGALDLLDDNNGLAVTFERMNDVDGKSFDEIADYIEERL